MSHLRAILFRVVVPSLIIASAWATQTFLDPEDRFVSEDVSLYVRIFAGFWLSIGLISLFFRAVGELSYFKGNLLLIIAPFLALIAVQYFFNGQEQYYEEAVVASAIWLFIGLAWWFLKYIFVPSEEELKEEEVKATRAAAKRRGALAEKIVCPHCNEKGQVWRRTDVSRTEETTGVGLAVLSVNKTRTNKKVTELRCGNCATTWDV